MFLKQIVRSGFRMIQAAVVVAVLIAATAQAADEPPPAAKSIDGIWQGVLKIGDVELRIVVRIAKDDQGQLKATMDSPDQGAKGIVVDSAMLEGDDVRLQVKLIQGAFAGKLDGGGQKITGRWKQPGTELPLELKRLDKEPVVNRPQEPKPPYPYSEIEVTYENAVGNNKLAGTLTLPKSDKPVAAALLISGSGAQDRDESLLGHKPFLVLADYLTRRGIAVLRVDDRGVGGSTGDAMAATTEVMAGDALAGVAFLKTRREINPRQIGLIGHSEGGIIAPLAASRSADVAFVVMMAGTGVTGEEILYRQGELIAATLGADPVEIKAGEDANRKVFQIIKTQTDPAKAAEQVRAVLNPIAAEKSSASPETSKAAVDLQTKMVCSPWFRFFLTYDPRSALRKVRCPLLAINGEKDLQVDPRQNLPAIEGALKEGGNRDYTIKEFAGLNHLFQHCDSGAPGEYGKIEETFAPEALELIADWIGQRTK